MEEQTTNRRARLRAEATHEIKQIALTQMADDGPGAISLRAIARKMGMTPRAIYSYFATRDDLVTALISDIATSLADMAEAARDAVPATDPGGRLLAWGEAIREWALANPEGFRLIYGDPIPGYQAPGDGPVDRAARRICCGLVRLVADVWPQARHLQPGGFHWSDFPDAYVTRIQEEIPDVSPDAVGLALRVWGRMQGLVTLEVHGHMRAVSNDPAAVHRAEMLDLLRSLGVSLNSEA